jgi:hypothetical protein
VISLVESLLAKDSKWVTAHDAEEGEQQLADEFLQFLLDKSPVLNSCTGFEMKEHNDSVHLSNLLFVDLAPVGKMVVHLAALVHAQFPSQGLPLSNVSNVFILVLKRHKAGRTNKSGKPGRITKDTSKVLLNGGLQHYDPQGTRMADFRLTGVVTYVGKSITRGHYTTCLLRETQGGDKWLVFDDNKDPVEIAEKTVLEQVIVTFATV